ncbi:MAG: hypothetical protein ABIY51_08550, partial [Ferruginibacter sp.]
RRIFEHLGYDVKGLDRVMYAGLTKKNVERSKWRYLSEKEIRVLKYMNESKKRPGKITAIIPTSEEKKILKPLPEKKLTSREISEAIGEVVPPVKKVVREKEIKIPKPRKFKTHSEKKQFNKNISTKK